MAVLVAMITSKALRGRRVLVWGSALVVLGIALAGVLVKLRHELTVQADGRAARRLVADRQFEEAHQPLERWLQARPSSAEAWFLTAQERFAANRFEPGFLALERARTLGHPPREIERQKAIVLSRLGKHNEAEPVLRRLLLSASKPDPEADEALAKCYLETFQLGQAESVISKWVHDAPGDVKPLLWKLELARKVKAEAAQQIEIMERILRARSQVGPGPPRSGRDSPSEPSSRRRGAGIHCGPGAPARQLGRLSRPGGHRHGTRR